MCQVHVQIKRAGKSELVMEEVTGLEVTGDGITVTSLFKDPHTVTGVRIHKIDFMANTVTLVPAGD